MTSSKAPIETPPATPPSPTASFYDLSDNEEGGYNTIMHATTGRGVKLLYSKSKVYVHPTPSAKDNISGFIALLQQKPPANSSTSARPSSSSSSRSVNAASFLLAWVPESSLGDARDTYVKVDLSDSTSPPKQSYLVPPLPTTSRLNDPVGTYAFAIPVNEIYSLLVRPPSLGWWFGSVVVNTRAGDTFPALFFHDSECQSTILQKKKRARENFDPFDADGSLFWGGDEVLRWLRRYVDVERSSADPSVYLIEPSEEDRKGFGAKPESPKAQKTQDERSKQKNKDGGMDPFTKALKETRWKVLESFSKITTFTRRTANDIAENPKVPPQIRKLMKNPEIQTLQEEFDSARLYLARWAMGIAEQSERERSQRIWTAQDVLEMEDSSVGEFEILDVETGNMSVNDRRKPVTLMEWNGWFDKFGRLEITPDEVKEQIFHGGLDPNDGVRKEAWLFLLGVYEWQSTTEERKAVMNSKRDEFVRLKGAWWERMVEGTSTPEQYEWWKEQRMRIDRNIPLFAGEDIPHPDPDSPFAETGTNVHLEQMKDMLLTYNEYNPDLGYVQGMSDLLAPIYAVMQDDAIAFWGFVHFMDRMERNFLRDQSGMRAQLLTLDHLVQLMDPLLYMHLQSADSTNFFFFFRMLLVWYKREFEWADVLHLWEILWSDWMSSQFHLFIALAILEKHREIIIQHLKHFDEVLKYINELSGTIDLNSTLIRAEALFRRFQRTVEAIDKKHNFPAPPSPIRSRSGSHKNDSTESSGSNTNKNKSHSPTSPISPRPQFSSQYAHATLQSVARGLREQREQQQQRNQQERSKAKIISPELRGLLSRKVIVLDKSEVVEHGGGVGK
ncbi:MAG: GTPase activating protein [Cirrosporium novae-zelandiae]|nr:MAG: GTPase activating protein [Cirrosporium novae-zelandiae]